MKCNSFSSILLLFAIDRKTSSGKNWVRLCDSVIGGTPNRIPSNNGEKTIDSRLFNHQMSSHATFRLSFCLLQTFNTTLS